MRTGGARMAASRWLTALRYGLCSLLLAPVLAGAQALGDPTQPPAALTAPGGVVAVDPAVPAPLQLQSILVSREAGGRRVAVINGELVRPGAKIGDAVVDSVNENTVVLRRGKSKEILRLFPVTAGKAGNKGAEKQ